MSNNIGGKILGLINKEIQEYNEPITIIDGWSDYSQKETIKQATLYYNSKFVDGEIDELGFKRYFYNISKSSCSATTKAIDIDTKDITLLTAPGGDELKTWFYERDLKYWMEDKNFGAILNRICKELPIFGSVVLKVIKGNCYFVDLKNLIVEQNADNLDCSNYIIEQNFYTRIEFKRIAKENGWDEIEAEKIVKLYKDSNEQYIRVFERYGEIENKDGLSDYKMVIIADIPSDIARNTDKFSDAKNDIVLAERLVPNHPYFEIHFDKISGRWLGLGVIEQISENQIRLNEVSNQQVRSSQWGTLRLFQCRDTGVSRNLLVDAQDGEVLNAEDEIKQVDMADRNQTYYQVETTKWESNANKNTFTTDVMMGERTPAGTPLGSAQLSVSMAMSYFDQKREDIGLAIKDLLYNYILPSFKKTSNREHIIRIAGQDLDKLNKMMVNTNKHKRFFDEIQRTNKIPSAEFMYLLNEVETARQEAKKEQQITIEKSWYGDLKYDIRIEVTGESKDIRVVAANLLAALQMMSVNPNVLQDPMQKRILSKYLELGGIRMDDFEVESKPSLVPTAPAGGGVSAQAGIQNITGQGTQQMTQTM
jgi:hypothetical protein